MKIVGCGSGSISQRDGSVDPEQDLHQNVMDPQHRNSHNLLIQEIRNTGIHIYCRFGILIVGL
jgi:hypothetical protein